jgi:hypothetical protein
MRTWPKHPVIYEINTWVWLYELSRKYNKPITLSSVPSEEWNYLSSFGFDAIWFMGVWERSPKGIQVALSNEGLMAEFHRVLPDLQPGDIVGSPYCVRRYVVDEHLGGPEGLAMARKILSKRNIRLILDYVPNNVAPDHPWSLEHPEYFIQGDDNDLNQYLTILSSEWKVFANGDPTWPGLMFPA